LFDLWKSLKAQFFGLEAERLAQADDQRNRWSAAAILDGRDVTGLDAYGRG